MRYRTYMFPRSKKRSIIESPSSNKKNQSNVCSTCTLNVPLSDNQRVEMMFLHERQKTANIQNTNQRQGIIYSGVNMSSTYQLTPLSNITRQNFSSSSNISTPGCSTAFNTFSVGSSSMQRTSHRNFHINEPIRMANLNEFEANDAPDHHVNVYKGISIAYLDHGDQNFMCGMCNALLWEAESKRGKTSNGITTYSLCCSYGDVQLPEMKSAPVSYVNLFLGVDSTSNFRLGGENYHSLGSLLPMSGQNPRFSQLYIYDTENEISNRRSIFGDTDSNSEVLDKQIINYLKDMLDSKNPLVKSYRMARDCFQQNPNMDLKLKIIGTRQTDARTYNLPTTSEVAALIVGDIGEAIDKRDIIVTTQSGALQRTSKLHPCYVPLQYPIFFPYGEDGYRIDIVHRELQGSTKRKRKKCTMRDFFSYRFQDRPHGFSLILNGGRLTQQLFVDAYTMIETQRWFGYPDFFLAITCNPNWPVIKRFLLNKNHKSEDRPDILCRLFKMKLDSLMKDLKDRALFGKLQAVVYTIEFQKRGLPHAHICFFLHPEHKIHNPENIDKFIVAEISDPNEDPELYSLVSDHMMHGPCGVANPKCSCMVDNSCSKNFPKKFQNETSIDSNGFPAHINVEWCNQECSIKYLFKYINKGPDRATISLVQDKTDNQGEEVDEVKAFYDCRYLSACEAAWRIFAFDVHYRVPSVTRLPFHLPRKQTVVFADDDDVEDVLNKPSVGSSKFIAWMECNQQYGLARTLTYAEFPTKFVWKPDERVKGPMCFEDIRTVDGEVCATYRDACYKRGLLDDDNEYIEAIEEASHTASDLVLSETQLKNLALLEIENFLLRNNSTLRCFPTMPFPDDDSILA
ncbi:uncharacterized protein LOC143548702 [Bidens hawaiensis]|uniref:uncharacterized protein LOC143548702 n=1 Tax=Bidens hawaiensis TaxID=980011 RepID=UPI00404B2DFA